MHKWMDNIEFVLVEPAEPGNIGSSARAIKNMGFTHLGLVRPAAVNEVSGWMAHGAEDVLKSAGKYETLDEAISNKALVVGISRRKGRKRGLSYPIDEAAARIIEAASKGRVAILFGREQRGLHNEETEECGFLVSIPTSTAQPSLNLAQAVMVVAYELSRSGKGRRRGKVKYEAPVEKVEIDRLCSEVDSLLQKLDYQLWGDRDIGKSIRVAIKQLMGRADITSRDFRMLVGLLARLHSRIE